MEQIRWEDLCEGVSQPDGLPARDVGQWSVDKLRFWHRYIQTTTTAMVGSPAWPAGIVYVDLFSGPGICRVRETGKLLPGSPLIAAYAAKAFRKIICVEFDRTLADACRQRLAKSPAAKVCEVLQGDSNELAEEVAKRLPDRALTLAFIDPEALDAKFETLRRLTVNRRVDLLILLADAFDIVRNVDEYERNPGNKLDMTLGTQCDWRTPWKKLTNRSGPNVRQFFFDLYCSQLKLLGYVEFGSKVIESPRGPIYKLVYASKHSRGLDFWNKALAREKDGQSSLFDR
ncbi:MAG: three-Cys-motif partner protein TcmP [Phycisphaerales bacterium]|nr:three-Cys-motif partner protein TcmP [Phycisphaerales bacterium]